MAVIVPGASALTATASAAIVSAALVTAGRASAAEFGDFDGNCQIDAADTALFSPCVSGPGGGIDPGCEPGDVDGDLDVDLTDFEFVQRVFGFSAPSMTVSAQPARRVRS